MGAQLDRLASVSLPGAEMSVRLARQYARDLLGEDFPGLYELTVVVSELFTNAVRHSASGEGGRVLLAFHKGPGVLRVTVTDEGGTSAPRMRQPDIESGRGLHVVQEYAEGWGVLTEDGQSTVWADFSIAGNSTVPM